MKTCIVCACCDSGSRGPPIMLIQAASITTIVFVLEEGVTKAREDLCDTHRRLVDKGRALARQANQEEEKSDG